MVDVVLRCTGGAFITVVLILTLRSNNRELALVLSCLTCCMIAMCALRLLQPVMDLLERLQSLGSLDHEMTRILLKTVGIGLLGEISSLVCKDSGNEALAKALQIVSGAAVLYLSLPLFDALLDLLEGMLGNT